MSSLFAKTYTGRTPEEAIAKAKQELGDDISIGEVKREKKSKWTLGGNSESLCVVDVYCNEDAPPPHPKPNNLLNKVYNTPPAPRSPRDGNIKYPLVESGVSVELTRGSPAPQGQDLQGRAPQYQTPPGRDPREQDLQGQDPYGQAPRVAEWERERRQSVLDHRPPAYVEEISPLTFAAQPRPSPVPPSYQPALDNAALLDLLRGEITRITSSIACGGVPQVGERYLNLYQELLEKGVAPDLANKLATELQYEVGTNQYVTDEHIRAALKRRLLVEFRVAAASAGQPQVVALIGPSGSGKTTTIVKLAFRAAQQNKSVALITEDINRPGAQEQLRSLISLFGLPLAAKNTPEQIAGEIRNFAHEGRDLILIDTGGRATKDARGMAELAANLHAAAPHETHLVIPATMAKDAALIYAQKYRECRFNRLLVTKTDEAETFGLLLNLARALPEPFSYLADGQVCSKGLTPATADQLARLVVNGE
ncbi:hypothetical protein FACS1894139_00110 [Planctomycetales bacterium]|nr:hypothetical protein FACS1894107_00980 [Planctomycetales bacterium]GHT02279.1 hypothetical protein FACS1894139_00110 [Planctomycetales bacterium]